MGRMMLAAALVLAVSTPVPAQDKAAIQQLNDRLAEAFNTGDAAAVAAMYTEDAVALPPGMEMIQGRDNIQAMWQGATEHMSDLKLTTTNVKTLGDSAVREIGTGTAKTSGDPPQDVTIKYVVVWEKVGDEWKIATDIWNMNQ